MIIFDMNNLKMMQKIQKMKDAPGPSSKLENIEVKPGPGIKKLENNKYNPVRKLDNCEFDNMRMCIEHRCVA